MRSRATLAATASLVLAALPALAQSRGAVRRPPRAFAQPIGLEGVPTVPNPPSSTALTDRLGVGVARRLLLSPDRDERIRALVRLGVVGTPRALEHLARAVGPTGRARTAHERLVAVRALGRHAARPEVRQTLVRLMAGVSGAEKNADPVERLAQHGAALALAAADDPEALQALGKSLRQEGPASEAAAVALVAHPPRNLDPILHARGTPSLALIHALGRLGDQRAFHALRAFVRRGSPEVRAEAAIALTRLGDLETVALARQWLGASEPRLRIAAGRILLMARTSDAAPAVAKLLADDATHERSIELAFFAPTRALLPRLEELIDDRPEAALAAIGRAGGPKAVKSLIARLRDPKVADLAGYALSLAAGAEATRGIEAAIRSSEPRIRRLGLRAAVVRQLGLGTRVHGSLELARALLAAEASTDRAVGAWALMLLDERRGRELLQSPDHVVVRAAARGLAAASGETLKIAAQRLASEKDPLTRAALGMALRDVTVADLVPTNVLLEQLEQGGADAPLVARALAARDDEALRPRLDRLLTSGDPVIRAHVALGLAYSKRSSVIGTLERAYRFETDDGVRLAIVGALAHRPERQRRRPLQLAARLDTDGETRARARLALGGTPIRTDATGVSVSWLRLVPSGGEETLPEPTAVSVHSSGGLALPAVADPDGLMVLTGLPAGLVDLRVAPTPRAKQVEASKGHLGGKSK